MLKCPYNTSQYIEYEIKIKKMIKAGVNALERFMQSTWEGV